MYYLAQGGSMSQFRINDHVRFRVMTSEGALTGSGQVIKVFPAGQSHWLHVRQGNGAVRMLYEATTQIEALELEAA
jgi:hypothetical protein